jgi:hypothetical protein
LECALCLQEARISLLEAGLKDQTDKADNAMSVAIAGIVLGVVLGLLGVLLGSVAVWKAGKSGSSGGVRGYGSTTKDSENPTYGVAL